MFLTQPQILYINITELGCNPLALVNYQPNRLLIVIEDLLGATEIERELIKQSL